MPENNSKFDLLVDDKIRLEIKSSQRTQRRIKRGYRVWRFNLHRHGSPQPNQADVYWLYIDGIPGFKAGISLIIPASEVVSKHQIVISLRSLLTIWSKWYMRMDCFKENE